jgi:exodeoxyribonuclease III
MARRLHAGLPGGGYHAVWRGERYGVAVLAWNREPVLIRDMLPGNSDDRQSRYGEAALRGIAVASIS